MKPVQHILIVLTVLMGMTAPAQGATFQENIDIIATQGGDSKQSRTNVLSAIAELEQWLQRAADENAACPLLDNMGLYPQCPGRSYSAKEVLQTTYPLRGLNEASDADLMWVMERFLEFKLIFDECSRTTPETLVAFDGSSSMGGISQRYVTNKMPTEPFRWPADPVYINDPASEHNCQMVAIRPAIEQDDVVVAVNANNVNIVYWSRNTNLWFMRSAIQTRNEFTYRDEMKYQTSELLDSRTLAMIRTQAKAEGIWTEPGRKQTVKIVGRELRLDKTIEFEKNSYVVTPASEDILLGLVDLVTVTDAISGVTVVGHSSQSGPALHNQVLSKQRARSVASWLIAHGLSPEVVKYEGRGESEPLVEETNPDAETLNRRVEFVATWDQQVVTEEGGSDTGDPMRQGMEGAYDLNSPCGVLLKCMSEALEKPEFSAMRGLAGMVQTTRNAYEAGAHQACVEMGNQFGQLAASMPPGMLNWPESCPW
jgi:outer membrane protein OmpA-like peptidoglycan-associated protein